MRHIPVVGVNAPTDLYCPCFRSLRLSIRRTRSQHTHVVDVKQAAVDVTESRPSAIRDQASNSLRSSVHPFFFRNPPRSLQLTDFDLENDF